MVPLNLILKILLVNSTYPYYHTVKYFGGWQITTICQDFFANISDEAHGHAVCVVNIRHVKQGI